MSKTTEEILNSICGKTTEKTEFNGLPRAISSAILCEITPSGEIKKTIQEATSVSAEVSVDFRGNFIQVNLYFESDKTDCHKFIQMLQKKDEYMNSLVASEEDVTDKNIYAVMFNFIPADMAENIGQIQGLNPIFYALTARNINENAARLDTLSMLFTAEDFKIFEYEDFDTSRMKIEIDSELESQDYTIRRAEEKRRRREEEELRASELAKRNN